MSNQRYPKEFKIEAVKQVTERGLPVAEVAARSTHCPGWVDYYTALSRHHKVLLCATRKAR